MHRNLAGLALAATLTLGGAACASATHTTSTDCHSRQVAPNGQPGSGTPEAALSWFVDKAAAGMGLPNTPYELESQSSAQGSTRHVYVNKARDTARIVVARVDRGSAKPVWAVIETISC